MSDQSHRNTGLLPLFILSIATLASGCHTVLDHVQVIDRDSQDVAASVVVRPESLRFGTRRPSEGGFEFGYERHRGNGSQTIDLNHYIDVANQRIYGPQTVVSAADIKHGHLVYDHLFRFGQYFELEPAIGVTYDRTIVDSRTTAPAASTVALDEDSFGVTGLITPRWNFNPYVGIEGRFRLGISHGISNSETITPSLILRPVRNMAIHVGYTWYTQRLETPNYTSNVDVEFKGPSVALRLAF